MAGRSRLAPLVAALLCLALAAGSAAALPPFFPPPAPAPTDSAAAVAAAESLQASRLASAAAERAQADRIEETLALRVLLGFVFPLLLLVLLRITRFQLQRWERGWRRALREGLERLAARRRRELAPAQVRNLVRALTGIERLLAYTLIAILTAFFWFGIFPETRPLAVSLLNRALGPLLELLGATARGLLTLLYSLFILGLALLITRWLARRWQQGMRNILTDPVLQVPLRTGIWLLAAFLILLPHDGAPRLFAMGLLLLAILALLISLRPVGEEIACGLYLSGTHALRAGDRLRLDGAEEPLLILRLGLAQVHVRRESEPPCEQWLAYSLLLRGKLSIQRDAERQA